MLQARGYRPAREEPSCVIFAVQQVQVNDLNSAGLVLAKDQERVDLLGSYYGTGCYEYNAFSFSHLFVDTARLVLTGRNFEGLRP